MNTKHQCLKNIPIFNTDLTQCLKQFYPFWAIYRILKLQEMSCYLDLFMS